MNIDKAYNKNGASQAILMLCSLSVLLLGLVTHNLLLLVTMLLVIFEGILVNLIVRNRKEQITIDEANTQKLKNLAFFVGIAAIIAGSGSMFMSLSNNLFDSVYFFLTVWLFLAGLRGLLIRDNKSAPSRTDVGIAIAFLSWSAFYTTYELVDDNPMKHIVELLLCLAILASALIVASSDFTDNTTKLPSELK